MSCLNFEIQIPEEHELDIVETLAKAFNWTEELGVTKEEAIRLAVRCYLLEAYKSAKINDEAAKARLSAIDTANKIVFE